MRAASHAPIPIVPAQIHWAEDVLHSTHFGDRYFSRDGGIAESEHVFLGGNSLPDRFQNSPRFVVGELGFGTGLNFLLTMKRWIPESPPGAQLFFLSYELHPLRPADLEAALEKIFGAGDLAAQLLAARYPLLVEGLHRVSFPEYRTTLFLNFGDAESKLPETVASVDAWYLDGFAPDRNPELWSVNVLQGISNLSHSETTASTYSVASIVRERMTALGWEVQKAPGFGEKRHMLKAVAKSRAPQKAPPPVRSVAVAGAGISGCAVFDSLRRRGIGVTISDPAGAPATGASGNALAAVLPYLSGERDPRHRFYLAGFLRLLARLKELGIEWSQCGALYLPFRERQSELMNQLAEYGFPSEFFQRVGAAEAGALCGVPVEKEAMYFPLAGTLSLRRVCEALLAGQKIEARSLERYESNETLVLATGAARGDLPASIAAAITPLKGEVAFVSATSQSGRLRTVLCGDGYVLPAGEGRHMIGATYHRDQEDTDPTEEGREKLSMIWSSYFPDAPASISSMRASVRASTYDRLPFVGRWNDSGRELFVSLGHGSRGGVSALLSAEILAAEICGEPLPVERSVLSAVDAQRIERRAARK